jgi:hypothetical protein
MYLCIAGNDIDVKTPTSEEVISPNSPNDICVIGNCIYLKRIKTDNDHGN